MSKKKKKEKENQNSGKNRVVQTEKEFQWFSIFKFWVYYSTMNNLNRKYFYKICINIFNVFMKSQKIILSH